MQAILMTINVIVLSGLLAVACVFVLALAGCGSDNVAKTEPATQYIPPEPALAVVELPIEAWQKVDPVPRATLAAVRITATGALLAASAAAVLLAAGTKGKRFALPHSRIMIHQPHVSGLGGQATDIDIHAKDLMRLRERLNEILAEHTDGVKGAQIKPLLRRRLSATFDESEYGFGFELQIPAVGLDFDDVIAARRAEADEFFDELSPDLPPGSPLRDVQRPRDLAACMLS